MSKVPLVHAQNVEPHGARVEVSISIKNGSINQKIKRYLENIAEWFRSVSKTCFKTLPRHMRLQFAELGHPQSIWQALSFHIQMLSF
jgi:hypothetical protein